MNSLTLQERMREANKVIAIIARHGRQFFYSTSFDRTARFGLDKADQIWYVDETSGMKLYPFDVEKKWPGFTHGSALKLFVERLAKYIEIGKRIELHCLPVDFSDELIAYGLDAMQQVRAAVLSETEVVTREGENNE